MSKMNSSVLVKQICWQQPDILSAGIDQTRLVIADAPTEPVSFSFMVMGDTDAGIEGRDSALSGGFSRGFSEGFAAQFLAHADQVGLDRSGLDQTEQSRFILHTGDVTYPVGSYENYLTGFLQPYRSLLKQLPGSAAYRAASVVFERPLLPVPGNHDYSKAGFGVWQRLLREMCDRLRQLLKIDLGHYGGQGGEAYGQTFLDDLLKLTPEQLSHHLKAHYCAASSLASCSLPGSFPHPAYCLSYQPGQFTRLPNRYYAFRYGGIDFFALDSNTWKTDCEAEDFDHAQLAWLEERLVQSVHDPNVAGRIIYLHHSPYTTEASRWQQPETLWVRRHLRAVFTRVSATVGERRRQGPVVDLVISGHAHCLEHLKTLDTGQGDAQMDWVVCGGSGASVRPQQKSSGVDVLENVFYAQRMVTEKVAQSCFFAGSHGKGAKRRKIHSFLRVDIRPHLTNKIRVVPFLVEHQNGRWLVRSLDALNIGSGLRKSRESLSVKV